MSDFKEHAASLTPRKIGILADSHGQPESIEIGIEFLRHQGCSTIYHLGDICDSYRPDTAERCVQHLKANRILAVKGNNDHTLVVNNEGQAGKTVPGWVLDYLRDLPFILEREGAVFAHSLPFAKELGLSSMIGVLKEQWARRFFCRFPGGILFRGHAHTPTVRWLDGSCYRSKVLSVGRPLDLNSCSPCIITCGAITRKLCMVWNVSTHTLTSMSLEPAA